MAALRVAVLLCVVTLSIGQTKKRGDVILTGGPHSYAGYLQVYSNAWSYGYVCDDGFESSNSLQNAGQVICRNLKRSFVSLEIRKTIAGQANYYLDSVSCDGDETNLDECTHDSWNVENCEEDEHVYITCASSCPTANCSHDCTEINNGTSYLCSCNAGYELDKDGITCADINECLADNGNGGCSHTCVNTVGSHHCECPRYLYLSEDKSTCTADGFTVNCTASSGMTIVMDKQTFFFLPEALTLLNTSCTSNSNSTHIWLYTDYNSCSTTRQITEDQIIYSNAVLDSENSVDGIRFFSSIKIPFQCHLSLNTLSQTTPTVNTLIMRIDGTGFLLEENDSLKLLSNTADDSPKLANYEVRQGDVVYAKLPLSNAGLKFIPSYCDVLSQDSNSSQRIIEDGKTSISFANVLSSDGFRFSYPAFMFNYKEGNFQLSCNSSLVGKPLLNSAKPNLIISKQEVDNAGQHFCHGLDYSQKTVIQVDRRNVTVFCDLDTPNGPWVTILQHSYGSSAFNKDFATFEAGFGDANRENFVGLKALHYLTSRYEITLRIDFEERGLYSEYNKFEVEDASTNYKVQEMSGYKGNLPDLTGHPYSKILGYAFSTTNRGAATSCARSYSAGWWFSHTSYCDWSCLTCPDLHYHGTRYRNVVRMKVKIKKDVVINSTHGVKIECDSEAMKLVFSSSEMVGLSLEDLQPLKENCEGFKARSENGNYVYEVPLFNCGADVKVEDEKIVFTNSLVYPKKIASSNLKHFSEVILTHSCSYPINGYVSALNYTVRSNDYGFKAKTKQQVNFDISLKIFSDKKFRNLLNRGKDGKSINLNDGREIFGDIGVNSSDPNLRVVLKDCKVTPTNNANDPNGHEIIRDGCATGYGTKMLSSDKFSLLSSAFITHNGQSSYLHCSVSVCDVNDMSRCQRQCSDQSANINVFGRRDTELSAPKIVSVAAGPFYIH